MRLQISGVNDVRVVNNTFYAPAGDNIRIEFGASEVEILNNILWAEAGYDIYVANDSWDGFYSDYNNLYATGTGKLVHYAVDFTDIIDWQADVARFDLHSIGRSVIDPEWAKPQFIQPGSGRLPAIRHACGPALYQPHHRCR